ncbi:MAG: radical SAM protein [Candidatus Asgardarchaeia archaeon]
MKKFLVHLVEKSLRKFLSYKELVEISSKLNFPLAPPLISSIQITMNCNSRCSHCDIWKLKENEMIDIVNLEEIFSSLIDLGIKIVSLTGGEPLTRDDISDIIRLARHYGLQPHICTNGIS